MEDPRGAQPGEDSSHAHEKAAKAEDPPPPVAGDVVRENAHVDGLADDQEADVTGARQGEEPGKAGRCPDVGNEHRQYVVEEPDAGRGHVEQYHCPDPVLPAEVVAPDELQRDEDGPEGLQESHEGLAGPHCVQVRGHHGHVQPERDAEAPGELEKEHARDVSRKIPLESGLRITRPLRRKVRLVH